MKVSNKNVNYNVDNYKAFISWISGKVSFKSGLYMCEKSNEYPQTEPRPVSIISMICFYINYLGLLVSICFSQR